VEQRQDTIVGRIMELMEMTDRLTTWQDMESGSIELQQLWTQIPVCEIRDGILYRQYQRPDGTILYYQLVVPRSLRRAVLENVHSDVISGHFGALKTLIGIAGRQTLPFTSAVAKFAVDIVRDQRPNKDRCNMLPFPL